MMGREYRIAVCDDQPQALAELSRIILEIGKEKGWQLTVNTYMDGEGLLQDIQELDVVFLDMEMPKEDGIGTGKKIRFYKPDCIIIMESGFVDRFKEAFTIGAQRYITKPYCTEELCEALGSVLHAIPGMADVVFPGYTHDYSGESNYSSFNWYDSNKNPNPIKYFNIVHCYKHPESGLQGETLKIETVYYGG